MDVQQVYCNFPKFSTWTVNRLISSENQLTWNFDCCIFPVSLCVGAINLMVSNEDSRNLLTCLQDSRAQLRSVTSMCADKYLRKMYDLKQKKSMTSQLICNRLHLDL